ncbi:hypothetical protein CU004_2128 [Enterococcus faecium]|nr:hypothetical protein [Enterococcus faecium]
MIAALVSSLESIYLFKNILKNSSDKLWVSFGANKKAKKLLCLISFLDSLSI